MKLHLSFLSLVILFLVLSSCRSKRTLCPAYYSAYYNEKQILAKTYPFPIDTIRITYLQWDSAGKDTADKYEPRTIKYFEGDSLPVGYIPRDSQYHKIQAWKSYELRDSASFRWPEDTTWHWKTKYNKESGLAHQPSKRKKNDGNFLFVPDKWGKKRRHYRLTPAERKMYREWAKRDRQKAKEEKKKNKKKKSKKNKGTPATPPADPATTTPPADPNATPPADPNTTPPPTNNGNQ